VVAPLLLCLAGATAAAFLLPERFAASCLILIKASGVPDKIVSNVSQELSARRHQTIRQEILSRTRLEKVNEELHPYPGTSSPTAVIAKMHAAIDIEFRGSDAFSIEYIHRDRRMAMDVANRVATLFIEEFRRSRQTQFEGAAEFLESELQQARRELDAKEEALRLYKERNLGRLPEQLDANLSTLQRLQMEMQTIEQNVEAAEARLERLNSRAGPDPGAPAATPAPSERELIEAELARLRLRYTDEHPDVQELQARLRNLRESAPSSSAALAADPSAQQVRAQGELQSLLARRQSVRDQIAALQARVELMPRSEQQLATLTRDFNQLRENYQTLLRKKLDAQMAERLEQRWTEDFEILDAARLPEHHVFPNRPLFMIGGLVTGLGFGIAASILRAMSSPYVVGLEELESAVPVPVLAVLSRVTAQQDEAARRFLRT
jgi:polysaccharide chain length determinant protein (PEP-CTERM system associated)